jgi:hypothetical protein
LLHYHYQNAFAIPRCLDFGQLYTNPNDEIYPPYSAPSELPFPFYNHSSHPISTQQSDMSYANFLVPHPGPGPQTLQSTASYNDNFFVPQPCPGPQTLHSTASCNANFNFLPQTLQSFTSSGTAHYAYSTSTYMGPNFSDNSSSSYLSVDELINASNNYASASGSTLSRPVVPKRLESAMSEECIDPRLLQLQQI